MRIKHFSIEDPHWYKAVGREIFLGDVLDASNSDSLGAGVARYSKGEENEWTVAYDEVLVITKGTFTVRTTEGSVTASAGEIIFLTKGTNLAYHANEDAELVYVSYPHWLDAQLSSPYADLLDTFIPVDGQK